MGYDFLNIEERWQQYWAKHQTFRTPNPADPGFDAHKPKFYVLDMFPYPSGVGLHVGHPLGYIATDIVARYKRMTGHNVLHPMGYDAFGLPAEQFAVEHGVHPRITTEKNIANMTRQLKRLGLSYDWDRCLATTDAGYYRWTQWIFLQLYHSWFDPAVGKARPLDELIGLLESQQVYVGFDDELVAAGVNEGLDAIAGVPIGVRKWFELSDSQQREVLDNQRLSYMAQVPVNWCPALGTVLANEEVTNDGRSERGNHPVFKRPLRQWMLRITAYAPRLLEELDQVDWPEPIKIMQRNWIGKSTGCYVDFVFEEQSAGESVVTVFTTRPDTLFGATYLVLAPEHPLVASVTTADQNEQVTSYCKQAAAKTDMDRQADTKQKTGVFTGSHVINPVNDEAMPVWIADYVMMEYGTGAIMAVPAHDRRDFEFAKQFGLPIRDVVYTPVLAAVGAFCQRFSATEELDEIAAGNQLADFVGLCANQSRTDYDQVWQQIVDRRDPNSLEVGEISSRGTISSIWRDSVPEMVQKDFAGLLEAGKQSRLIEHLGDPVVEDGIAVNGSNAEVSLDGLITVDAKKTIIAWLESKGTGKAAIQYRLRDWLFSRQRYWGEPFPILHGPDGQVIAIDESQLPVELPEMEDFKPSASNDPNAAPQPPLSRAPESWRVVEIDGVQYRRELNTMPQWAGSCWYYLRFLDPHNGEQFLGSEAEAYWTASSSGGGVDLYVGGAEHAVLHLLYARFWHKVLYDLGHVSKPEPFGRLFNQGYIQTHAYTDSRGVYVPAEEIEHRDDQCFYKGEKVNQQLGKMGKSLKNSIAPDDICEQYGCDTLRLYEMYLGPLDQSKLWRTRDIVGVHRFLHRLWRNFVEDVEDETGRLLVTDEPVAQDLERLLHKTIKRVTDAMDSMSFNVAIAALIELNNELVALKTLPRKLAEPLVLCLAPMAPHMAEELWHRMGHDQSLACHPWPSYDPAMLVDDQIEYPVQINGKLRGRITVSVDADDETVEAAALGDEKVNSELDGKTVRKVIVVKGRMVNIVVGG